MEVIATVPIFDCDSAPASDSPALGVRVRVRVLGLGRNRIRAGYKCSYRNYDAFALP